MQDRDLQNILDEAAQSLGVVGAQLAIADASGVRAFATGHRHLELDLPVTVDTLFQIGSTTKVFNAALVMALVDQGRLDLDEPVLKYVPDLRLANLEAKRVITLRQLLSMTAGIDSGTYHDYGRGDDALGRYVDALAGVTPLFAPGSGFSYSNASTNLAGYAAVRAASRTWEALLTEHILHPLGLKHAAMFAEDLLSHAVALGYRRDEPSAPATRVEAWALPRSMAPAGGTLCLSAGDLARFGRMFVDRGRAATTGNVVLSEAAIDTMQMPQVDLLTRYMADQWCVGPYRKLWDGVEIYGHSGTNIGGSSMLLWCPERDFAIATLVNVANKGYPLAQRVFEGVLPALFGIHPPPSADLTQQGRAGIDLAPYVGRYEALGITMHVRLQGDTLMIVEDSDVARLYGTAPLLESELIPLGDDRFLPRNPTFSGNRLWDVAFWGKDEQGRPSHYLNGIFAYRRTG